METHEGFSIREYVSRMRSVNVVKCWPFDETTSDESVKSLLPPIAVKKYIWWLDGLEYLHSESSKNVVNSKKKKKVQKKGESSFRNESDVEESDVDVGEGMGVVKVKSSRAKAKAPKKRSILEIFAVAPQVERVNSDEEEEEEEEENSVQEEEGFCIGSKLSCNEEINWGLKGKRNKKKKKRSKNKEIIVSKLKKAKKVMKKIKKKKKGDDKIDLSVPNKVDCYMFKLQDQDKAIENQNSSYTRKNENDIHDHVSIHKEKPRPQHLDAEKKNMAGKACRLIAQKRHQGNPKRGILKNHTKAFSLQQSNKCLLQEAVQVNHFGRQKANKHVKFLQKDNILGIRRKPSLPVECFKLQKCCGSDMHNVHYASNVGKDSAIVETTGTEDVSNRIVNEMDAKPAIEEQLTIPCCMVDTSTLVKQHNKGKPFNRSVTSSRTVDGKDIHLFNTCLGETPHAPKYACPPGSSCTSREVYYNSRNTQVIANSSCSLGGRLNENFETSGPRFPPACFKQKTYNEFSVSCLSNLGKRANKMPQASTALNDAHPIPYETFPDLSPGEFLQTVCSQPHPYRAGNICGERSINGINEDFVGSPLNSQRELIALSSSAQGDFNQTIKSSITAAPSISSSLPDNTFSKCFSEHSAHASWDCRTSSMEQLNLLDYLEENPAVFVPSRLDTTESRGNGGNKPDLDLIKISNHFLHSENSICNEDNGVQKSHGHEKILSTMRLMGKEFIVDGKGFRGFGDKHIWKDKQIIDDFQFSSTSISNVMMHDQNEPSMGKLRESLFVPPETNCHRSGSMYTFPHFDWQTSLMHQNGFVTRKINAEKVYTGLSPSTSSELYNSKPLFPEPFPSANQDSCPDVSSSDIQLKNNQNIPHALRSAIRFPFMHPRDFEGHAQSSWTLTPHGSQSPWSFYASENGMFVNNFQSYHHDLGRSHHHVAPGSNWRPDSSVFTKPEAFCLYNPFSFGSTLQTSMGPASLHPTLSTQQAPTVCYPGAMPIPSVTKRHENLKKIREGIESRIGIRGLDHGRKANIRQPSAVSNVSFRPVRLPSLGFDKSFQCDITNSSTFVTFEGVQNVETALESCSATNKSKIPICDRDDQNEVRIYPWIDSYSSTARSSPTKLTAGAKHILKPRHQIYQSSSRSTDSNIPLGGMSADFRFSKSENSTKIYKF